MDPERPRKITFEELVEADISERVFSEFSPFSDEIAVYKDSLVKNIMDFIGKEIDKLPETQREVLYAYYFGGKTFRQIGIELGLAEDAVRLRKHRAILTLQKQLADNPYVNKLYEQLKEEDPPLKLLVKLAELLKK